MYRFDHGGMMFGGGLTMLLRWLLPIGLVVWVVLYLLKSSAGRGRHAMRHFLLLLPLPTSHDAAQTRECEGGEEHSLQDLEHSRPHHLSVPHSNLGFPVVEHRRGCV